MKINKEHLKELIKNYNSLDESEKTKVKKEILEYAA